MKRAIVTISIGELYQKISNITHKSIKAYADKIGVDFVVIDKTDYPLPHYAKCHLKDLLTKYDRIAYIDSDIIISPNAPDIFQAVPEDKLGLFEEGKFGGRYEGFIQYLSQYNIQPEKVSYFNTGVIVASKIHKEVFRVPFKFDNHFFEQTYLNMNILTSGFDVHFLSYKFNRMSLVDKKTGEHRLNSYFIHYAGLSNVLPEDKFLNLIETDLKDLESGDYFKGYNVAVRVGGGYGDTIAAEPTVRYMVEHLYKNDNVIILTYLPEVFAHIKAPVYKMDDLIPNADSYYVVDTLVGTSEPRPIHGVVSAILCHACNYASISALGMELPIEHRNIKLNVDDNALYSVNNKLDLGDKSKMVLMHLGVSWPSKTIPSDVWQSYIDILVSKGFTPVLIGKDISLEIKDDFRGVAKDINTEGCIDLRNDLSFLELIAIVSLIPTLISNDSVPVHIAGAFDNWIGLISTCKNADFILPHRKGRVYYKAKNLSIGKPWDQFEARRNYIDGSNVDQMEESKLRACLPTPEDILSFVKLNSL